MFVGWDWASEAHDVTVVDDEGAVVARWSPAHSRTGLEMVIGALAHLDDARRLPVAIERPDGLVVARLLEAGHPVVPVPPHAFYASRPRWGAARAKSDPADSYMLADLLRTDGHRFAALQPLDQATSELQALCRLREDHVAGRTAATNQLGALLDVHWPGAKAVFSKLGSAIALAFLDDYPTPEAAARLGPARMARFCQRHSYRGGRSPQELLDRLRAAPTAITQIGPDVLEQLVRAQVALIRTLLETIEQLDDAIDTSIHRHPKAGLFERLPHVGRINLGQLLAEIGPILERASSAEHAATLCGAVPVTKASGKTTVVQFRWATNTKARRALGIYADNSRHGDAWAAHRYNAARQRGHRHPHAIRILMRSWLRVMWACWHTNIPYDPSRHQLRA
jgi:transposase